MISTHIMFTSANKQSSGLVPDLLWMWELRELISLTWATWSWKMVFKGTDAAEITYIHLTTTLHRPRVKSLERSVLTAAHPVWAQGPVPPFLPTPSSLCYRSQTPTGFPLPNLQGPGVPDTDKEPAWDHLTLYCHQAPWVWLGFVCFVFFHEVYSTHLLEAQDQDTLIRQSHSTSIAFEEWFLPKSFLLVSNSSSNSIERATSRESRV